MSAAFLAEVAEAVSTPAVSTHKAVIPATMSAKATVISAWTRPDFARCVTKFAPDSCCCRCEILARYTKYTTTKPIATQNTAENVACNQSGIPKTSHILTPKLPNEMPPKTWAMNHTAKMTHTIITSGRV